MLQKKGRNENRTDHLCCLFSEEKTNNGSVSNRDDSRVCPDFPHAKII